MSLIAEMGN